MYMDINKEPLLQSKANLRKFWSRYSNQFNPWWTTLNSNERTEFIRDSFPTIAQSPIDRYTYDNTSGNLYLRNIYARELLMYPEFTIDYVIEGTNLSDWIESFIEDNYIVQNTPGIVTNMRELYNKTPCQYPFNESVKWEENKHKLLSLNKGDKLIMNGFDTDQNLGCTMDIATDDGMSMFTGPDSVVNVYELGAVIHPFEYTEVCQVFGNLLVFLLAVAGRYLQRCLSYMRILYLTDIHAIRVFMFYMYRSDIHPVNMHLYSLYIQIRSRSIS